MATAAMDYETADGDRYEDDGPRYERDQRSASPRPPRDDGHDTRRRSLSPNRHDHHCLKDDARDKDIDDGAVNPGSNLFVTGIHPRLTEDEVTRLFEKYGEVEKCQIMRDPHTKESRGFGFVKMVTSEQADAAKDGLQGETVDSRTFSIEKARRARPRTPTPGKYFGPPKRGEDGRGRPGDRRRGGGFGGGGGYGGGGYGGGHGRDDPYRYRGGGGDRRDEYRGDRGYREDRGYDRGYRDDRAPRDDRAFRDDRAGGSGASYRDRDDGYSGSRVDRYGGGREDRRDRGYDRDGPRSRDPAPSGYGDAASGRDYGAP